MKYSFLCLLFIIQRIQTQNYNENELISSLCIIIAKFDTDKNKIHTLVSANTIHSIESNLLGIAIVVGKTVTLTCNLHFNISLVCVYERTIHII